MKILSFVQIINFYEIITLFLFLDSLFRLSTRLKNVFNPYNVLAPIPVQLSEAVMNFQEKNTLYTNRVIIFYKVIYHIKL